MTTTTNSGRARAREGGRRRARGASGPASERRDHLVRLAAELFAKKGFQATTVREIADEAGILSGSLYHHFDSKESIVDEILSNFFTELMAANRAAIEEDGGPEKVLAALVRIAFGTLEPHRAAITVLQNDWNYLKGLERFDYLFKAEEDVEEMWVTAIRNGQTAGLFRADLHPRLTYRMIRDTIWVAVRWFHTDGGFDAETLTDHYVGVLLDGIHIH
ncbi:TetR/AcrR family transcriptional regulator [Actinocorallia populi]|uniref:TetR/AcrR family transcriptional regulator n=1 Tax=Actinocorallia populi TaxID=2079200 RepID=UPI000D09265A|nr:TetR/AcrR family transcriptional regulator [Actinocorallia populi]